MPSLPPWAIKTIHIVLVVTMIVGSLGPEIAQLMGIVPGPVYAVISHIVAVAAGITAWIAKNPWVTNFLGVSARPRPAVGAVGPATMLMAVLVQTLLLCALLLCLAVAGLGCISSAPTVPVTPANQAQIYTCQTTADWHNGIVVGDMVLGASTPTLAAVAAALPSSSSTAKSDLAVSAAVVGGALGVGAALAGYTAANFANSQCSQVVGALPAAPALGAKKASMLALPPDEDSITVVKPAGSQ